MGIGHYYRRLRNGNANGHTDQYTDRNGYLYGDGDQHGNGNTNACMHSELVGWCSIRCRSGRSRDRSVLPRQW
jgi:hypothetical protein